MLWIWNHSLYSVIMWKPCKVVIGCQVKRDHRGRVLLRTFGLQKGLLMLWQDWNWVMTNFLKMWITQSALFILWFAREERNVFFNGKQNLRAKTKVKRFRRSFYEFLQHVFNLVTIIIKTGDNPDITYLQRYSWKTLNSVIECSEFYFLPKEDIR